MLKAGSFDRSIECAGFDIVLRLDPLTVPSANLSQLDYSSNDDKIVGVAKSYIEKNSGEVKLITHDTGPSATAHAVGVPFYLIPDDWLRPTEENPELANALRRLLAFENQEPAFEVDGEQLNNGKVIFEIPESEPLTPVELEKLIARLKSEIPMATEFSDAAQPSLPSVVTNLVEYQRPSNSDIERYQEYDYPSWLENAEKFLSEHRS